MNEFKEKKFKKVSLETREELIENIVLYQDNLFKIEVKLGNIEDKNDENYLKSFKERLNKLNISSLKKYYYMLVDLYSKKLKEYNDKVQMEQTELLNSLIEEYLGEEALSIPVVNDVFDIQPGQNDFYPYYPWSVNIRSLLKTNRDINPALVRNL